MQRYQLAVDEAKVRLNLAVAPGTWLMPARMVLNTGSVAGYNNQLRQATPNMQLGVNNSVNLETKKVGVRLMDGGPSKIDRPTSHPSNPIHKANPIHSNPIHKDQKTFQPSRAKLPTKSEGNHEILKAGVFIGAAVSAFASFINYSDLIKIIKSAIFLFKPFNHERRNTKNKESSIFAEEANYRSSGFEKNKADDCSDKTRKYSRDLFSKFLESVSDSCGNRL